MPSLRKDQSIRTKRAYAKPERGDGARILVDRLWPRGLTKEKAAIDLWLKELAPSTELRKWFAHDPKKWRAFRSRYVRELQEQTDQLDAVRSMAGKRQVTLIYGARDQDHNEAIVLKDILTSGK